MQKTNNIRNSDCTARNSKQREQPFGNNKCKILPHITKQFDFRIANRLLIQKIISPRRDKTIIDSLANTTTSYYKNKRSSRKNQDHHRRKIIIDNNKKQNTNYQPTKTIHHHQGKPQKQIHQFQKSVSKPTFDDPSNFVIQTEDLSQSKWKDFQQKITDACNDKKLFGRIVRNTSSFLGLLTRRTNDNKLTSNGSLTGSKQQLTANRWKGSLIRRNISHNKQFQQIQ